MFRIGRIYHRERKIKNEKRKERKKERERFCIRLKLNRISVQRRSTVFCIIHVAKEKNLIVVRGTGVVLAASFSFKLFSVRWRVLRNNPFIKVICETASSKQRASLELHSSLVLTYPRRSLFPPGEPVSSDSVAPRFCLPGGRVSTRFADRVGQPLALRNALSLGQRFLP